MSEWRERPLGELLELIIDHRGKTPKKVGGVDFAGSGVPVVSAIHIKGGRVDWSERERYVPQWMFEKWMPVRLIRGDVLLTSEAPLGEVAQVPSDDDLVLSQRLFALRGRVGVLDSTYLRYFLQTAEGQSRLRARSSGTTVLGIRQAELVKIPIPLPPFDEQQRIAAVLGVLDDLIESDRAIQQASLETAKAVYEGATADSDFELTLGNAGTWHSGGTPSTSEPAYWGGHLPWISAASLQTFFLTASDRRLTTEGATNGTRVVPAGTILFVVRGMSLKSEFRVGVAQRDLAFGQDCKAIVVDPKLPKSTVAVGLLTRSAEVLQLVDEASHGTGRLQTDRIERLSIRLPSATRIGEVESTLSALLKLGADAEESISVLRRTRDELLPLLISGRVRVSEDLAVA